MPQAECRRSVAAGTAPPTLMPTNTHAHKHTHTQTQALYNATRISPVKTVLLKERTGDYS